MPVSAKAILVDREREEREVHKVSSSTVSPTVFRLLITRIFHFFYAFIFISKANILWKFFSEI